MLYTNGIIGIDQLPPRNTHQSNEKEQLIKTTRVIYIPQLNAHLVRWVFEGWCVKGARKPYPIRKRGMNRALNNRSLSPKTSRISLEYGWLQEEDALG
jgi:hypothetical protein